MQKLLDFVIRLYFLFLKISVVQVIIELTTWFRFQHSPLFVSYALQ